VLDSRLLRTTHRAGPRDFLPIDPFANDEPIWNRDVATGESKPPPCVCIRRISKTFEGVRALRDVSLDLFPGEIHALCGENGAGKSTLIKILAGVHVPDSGNVTAWGEALPFGNVLHVRRAGIAVIHQESTAFPDLTAAENMFAGREPRCLHGLVLDRARMRREAAAAFAALAADISPDCSAGLLSPAEQQVIAIAGALSEQCRLLILDEPTASLSEHECASLFQNLERLRSKAVSILYVSHRLDEVFALADRVTVLRDGRLAATRPVAGLSRPELVRLMVGREVTEHARQERSPDTDRGAVPRLETRGLTRRDEFQDVSLHVSAGEIVGLAGLVGAGRSELARCLFGLARPDAGEVRVGGRLLTGAGAAEAIRAHMALVPEDRQRQGLVLPLPVRENLGMAVLHGLKRRFFRSAKQESALARRLVERLGITPPNTEAPTRALSGGNQQKVVLGKWLATDPEILVLDEPTRGVDVGAKAEIHRLVRELAQNGTAVLLISSELPELLALSDRILVMRAGRIVANVPGRGATQEQVLELALPDSSSTAPTAKAPARTGIHRLFRRREWPLALFLAMLCAVVAGVSPHFLAPGNLSDMLVNAAPAVIAGCGLTLVIATGEIDISIGSMMGLLAALLGTLSAAARLDLPVPVAVALVLAAGTVLGIVNGSLVALAGIPSIIVTLAMLTILRGLTELVMGGEWITDLPAGLRVLGTGTWAGLPLSIWTAAFVAVGVAALVRRTSFGLHVFAAGSNPEAAAVRGISVRRTRLTAFAITGLLTACATVVSVPRLSVVESGIGQGFELLVVTCVVVGGASIRGGSGTIAGSVLGALLLTTIGTMLIFLRLGATAVYWERTVQGAFILIAVLSDHWLQRSRRRMEAA